MTNNNEKPRVRVSIGNEISVREIASKLGLDSSQVNYDLESAIKEHFFHFASKPVILEYQPTKGYTIKATSSVGILNTPNFVLDISPKIPGLSIGKALGLAQESGISLLNINKKSLAKNAFSENSTYSAVDFLGFSLVDAVLTIRQNGFSRKFEEVLMPCVKLRGDISFQDTIANGLSIYNPIVNNIESSLDIYPNQVIKVALNLCKNQSTSLELIELAQLLLDSLSEVRLIPEDKLQIEELFFRFTVPRPDYDLALAFSKALIEGSLISEEESNVLTPSFTLDMDKVFESYCTTQIQNLILPNRFDVLAQKHFSHDLDPDVADKNIIPDIIIRDRKSNEIIILDLKNKYSQLRDEGEFKIGNNDLYQLAYYAKTLKAKCCFVVYPGATPRIQYPLKSSESQLSYEQKRQQKLNEIMTKNRITIFKDEPVILYSYTINLLGTLHDTKKSIASLCQLLVDI